MKKNMLTNAIYAVAAAAAVTSGSAVAYDSDITISGQRAQEFHFTRGDFAYADNGTSSVGGEFVQIYKVLNATVAPTPTAIDTYAKANGDAATGVVTQEVSRVYLPAIPAEIDNGTGVEPSAWDLTTNGEGKITSGWIFNESNSPSTGEPVYNFVSFDKRRGITLNVCNVSGEPSITDAETVMDGGAVPAGCTLTHHGDLAYETCDLTDECGQLSKSVPVPALASAGLALGLAGITLLTSRRRSIK